jgi:phosphatidylethanolamine/phosphatidyl-N-methylethanolamine N-methyltransferase
MVMNDHTLFLGKFFTQLTRGNTIASIAPSSRWLSRTTVRNIDWDRAKTLVELGAGTGPITRVLAERARPDCRVIVVERDADFARLLRERFGALPHFDIVEGDAQELAPLLADRGIAQVDHVISGLPVPSFPRELQHALVRLLRAILRPEGTFNQITEIPWVYWPLYRKYFEHVEFAFEPRNLPPSGAYFCRGPKDIP